MDITRGSKLFVPKGANRFWPFVIEPSWVGFRSRWKSQLVLCRSILEARLGLQPTEPRENWRILHRDLLANLMHSEGAGKEHPSRAFVASLMREGDSVLDVGCGAGAGYEALAAASLESRYVGIDSSEPSIEIARELYPAGDFRIGSATSLLSQFGPNSFDVVLVRHVLEHLPDFETAMTEAISVSRRLALFVFFLTPRSLPLGVRKVDLCINRPTFYAYVYSRRAVNRFLSPRGLHWRWFDNLGASRAAWFAGEVNSALVVSRDQLELGGGVKVWC
jgi:SAM-dependent methyltransferase